MTAERKQAIVVIPIILAIVGAMVYAFMVGQGEGLNAATGAAKPFTTDKPRDITMPIARSEKAKTPDFDSEDLANRDASPKDTKMLLMDSRLRERLASNEGERLAMEAFAQSDPAKGVTMLEDQLSSMTVAAEAAAVYSALGKHYLQTDPPQVDQALASLRAASRVAETSEVAHHALLSEITLLQDQRGWEVAGPRLLEAHPEGSASTIPGLQLSVLAGKYHEVTGDIPGAERVYKDTAERARELREHLGPDADQIYRQVCLNLSRLYRESGREGDAEKVLRAMRLRLDDGSPPAL
jgi:hypothetical protein